MGWAREVSSDDRDWLAAPIGSVGAARVFTVLLRRRSADHQPIGVTPGVKVLVGAVCLAVLGPVVAPTASEGVSIAQKRKQAERLRASIDATATKIELLNEDYLDAQVRLNKLTKKVKASSKSAAEAEGALAGLRKRIRAQALAVFASPPGSNTDGLRDSESINELERRAAYAKRSAVASFDAEDALNASLQTLNETRSAVNQAKAEAAGEVKILESKRKKAAELLKEYEALQAQAEGELADLVKAAEKAAAEREVAAALAAQRKAQAAARAELERRRKATRLRLGQGTSAGVGASGGGEIPQVSLLPSRHSKPGKTDRTGSGILGRAGPTDPASQTDAQLAIEAGIAADVPASPGAAAAVRLAMAQLGKPYIWATSGPSSFDCSGLMLFAWRAAGVSLPHSSRSQFASTTRVSVSQIRPGDLVFFGRPIHHVGMYVGNGQMVEASRSGRPVKLGSILRRDMVGVGRIR